MQYDWPLHQREEHTTHRGSKKYPTEDEMKATLKQLRQSALESCRFRRHTMNKFTVALNHPRVYMAQCNVCGKSVYVTLHPEPNDIDIGGAAVALGCED